MKKTIVWWALKDRNGEILQGTIAITKSMCWELGFWEVAQEQGDAWKQQYWQKLSPSIRSAQKLGYKFCRVKIVEAK